jgi:hypothetical protein
VFTTNNTLPLYWHKDWGFSSCKRSTVWLSNAGQAAWAPVLIAHAKRPKAAANTFRFQARFI